MKLSKLWEGKCVKWKGQDGKIVRLDGYFAQVCMDEPIYLGDQLGSYARNPEPVYTRAVHDVWRTELEASERDRFGHD